MVVAVWQCLTNTSQYEEPIAEDEFIPEEQIEDNDDENEYQEEYGIDTEDMVEEIAQDEVDSQEEEE